MNDFTKDELTDLIFCVKDHERYQDDSIHENLINKLQSLIDNYCDHIWTEGSGNHLFCCKCHTYGGKR